MEEPSLTEFCFSNLSFPALIASLASKLFIDWADDGLSKETVIVVVVAVVVATAAAADVVVEGFSTMVIALRSRQARRWLCSFFFRCAWANLKSFKEQRRESKLIVWLSLSSRD